MHVHTRDVGRDLMKLSKGSWMLNEKHSSCPADTNMFVERVGGDLMKLPKGPLCGY